MVDALRHSFAPTLEHLAGSWPCRPDSRSDGCLAHRAAAVDPVNDERPLGAGLVHAVAGWGNSGSLERQQHSTGRSNCSLIHGVHDQISRVLGVLDSIRLNRVDQSELKARMETNLFRQLTLIALGIAQVRVIRDCDAAFGKGAVW